MKISLIILILIVFCSFSVFAQQCGDVTNDGMINMVDYSAIENYIHGFADPSNIDSGNVDGECIINISDFVYLNQYMYAAGPGPNCADTSWCDYTTVSTEIISVEPPPYSFYPSSDSFPVQVYITNTSTLYGVSIGLNYPSDDIEITSISTSGTVTTGGFGFRNSFSGVDNEVLVTWLGNSILGSISTQNEGLLYTLNVQKLSGNPENGFALEPVFVPPGGNFIFVQTDMTTLRPDFIAPYINTINITNLNNSGVGSLRWAIDETNTNPGPDAIEFTVSGTINPTSALPDITDDGTEIYGGTAPSGAQSVIVDGSAFVGGKYGLDVSGQHCSINDMVFTFWDSAGIRLTGDSNTVIGNNIGVDAAGNNSATLGHGLIIESDFNNIGGCLAEERNYISCGDDKYVVWISGDSNTVVNSYINLRTSGILIGNDPSGEDGVYIESNGNQIGLVSCPNYIGGVSTGGGIYIDGARENRMEGNYIGLSPTLVDTIPNGAGIDIRSTSKSNTIGPGNIIVAGISYGVNLMAASGLDSNIIIGNIIAESGIGIGLNGPTNTVVGGYNSTDKNEIFGINAFAIDIAGSNSNKIIGNRIGYYPAQGNGGYGIRFRSNSNSNLIDSNIISYNAGYGMTILDNDCLYNTFTKNEIFENGFIGIDLNNDGVTINDPGDADTGPNNLFNYPELDSLYMKPDSSFTAYGSAAANAIVEFFVAHPVGDSTRPPDPTGYGEAHSYIGTETVDGSGKFTFDIAKETGQFSSITMTATDVDGNTSEFSDNYLMIASPLIIVGYAIAPDLINLKVTDPDGDYIGKDASGFLTNTIGLADYNEIDTDSITIHHPIQGEYLIEVIAEDGPSPIRATYYVGIRIDGTAELKITANATVPTPGETDYYYYEVEERWHFINGDANRDELINILDIVYLINYKYKDGPNPWPEKAGEGDCVDPVNILDIVHIINFKYKGGPEPCPVLE